eukprot:jgi/Hompol1/6190/HPOL_004100-RA
MVSTAALSSSHKSRPVTSSHDMVSLGSLAKQAQSFRRDSDTSLNQNESAAILASAISQPSSAQSRISSSQHRGSYVLEEQEAFIEDPEIETSKEQLTLAQR